MSCISKSRIFNKMRTAMAVPVPPPTPFPVGPKTLLRIRAYLYSSSSSLSNNQTKDPSLVDDIKEGEGVFRFDAADGEPEMTPMTPRMTPNRKGSTVNKAHRWNAATDGMNKDTRSSTTVGDMAKAGTVAAMETGINMGEMAKPTMDNVWDAAKETTQKIKETVAGDGEDERKGYDIPGGDNSVDEMRKKAGGYDLRNRH